MDITAIQQQLFVLIKTRLKPDAIIVDEIAAVLDISTDSAYRRIRAEKIMSFDEVFTLCRHYRISMDQLANIEHGAFVFQGNLLNKKTFHLDDYFKGMLKIVSYFNSFREKEYYYLCKDVPIFYHFLAKEIAAFKYFFWMHSIFDFPDFANKKFSFDLYPDEIGSIGENILAIYNEIPSVEFWNVENINVALRQVEFYRDIHMFKSDYDALRIYEAWEKVIDHVQSQAELGYKYKYGDDTRKPMGTYKVYFNEVIIGDNSMMAILDNKKMALLPHTVINYMSTSNIDFCENMYNYIQNLARRSTLISEVSEKERSKFFRILRERILIRKEALRL